MVVLPATTDETGAPECQAKSPIRPLGRHFELPKGLKGVHTLHRHCGKLGKAQIFTPLWELSGEFPFILPPECLVINPLIQVISIWTRSVSRRYRRQPCAR